MSARAKESVFLCMLCALCRQWFHGHSHGGMNVYLFRVKQKVSHFLSENEFVENQLKTSELAHTLIFVVFPTDRPISYGCVVRR